MPSDSICLHSKSHMLSGCLYDAGVGQSTDPRGHCMMWTPGQRGPGPFSRRDGPPQALPPRDRWFQGPWSPGARQLEFPANSANSWHRRPDSLAPRGLGIPLRQGCLPTWAVQRENDQSRGAPTPPELLPAWSCPTLPSVGFVGRGSFLPALAEGPRLLPFLYGRLLTVTVTV